MSFGPCMCGDICCPSCGPAQGNGKCLACGAWESDGCECTGDDIEKAKERAKEAYKLFAEEIIRSLENDRAITEDDSEILW